MYTHIKKYLNEIIGITLMVAMCLALISGEAAAVSMAKPVADETHVVAIDIEFSFRHQGE